MPGTAVVFTPSQLRELRSDMEDTFARVLRSMSGEPATVVPRAGDSRGSRSTIAPDELDTPRHQLARERLSAISAALRRIDTGAYGTCVACGNRIAFARLEAMPEATLCLACGELMLLAGSG